MDEDRQRHPRRTTTCTPSAKIRRAAACSTPARSTASTSRTTTATLALAVAEPAGRAGLRPLVEDNSICDLRRTAAASTSSTTSRRCASSGLETASADVVLFKPADAIRGAGGATITYRLKQAGGEADDRDPRREGPGRRRRFRARRRRRRRRARARRGAAGAGATAAAEAPAGEGGGGGADAAARRRRRWPPGLNRVTWDLRYPGATTFPGMILWGATTNGPPALPGTYQVRLTVDGQRADAAARRQAASAARRRTDADLQEQFDLAIQIRDKIERSEQRGDPDPRASSARSPIG